MSHESKEPSQAEFDAYAADYSAGMDVGMKRLLGNSAESFLEIKASWLRRHLARNPLTPDAARPRLLDYGCGVGTFLHVLCRLNFPATLAGCDVSAEMLREACKRWPTGQPPEFELINNGRAPYADHSFDLVVLSAVMHHVPIGQRNEVYADGLRLLRVGGRLVVFEHNPFNPVTQWVVRHTPIDQNAVLLRPREVVRGVRTVGKVATRTRYLMFFPPRMTALRPVERFFGWCPLGGQYVVVAEKTGNVA
jgi:SAM-dependent methyltransferase